MRQVGAFRLVWIESCFMQDIYLSMPKPKNISHHVTKVFLWLFSFDPIRFSAKPTLLMSNPKPILDIEKPLDELVDLAESHISTEDSVFQKSGELVHIMRDKDGGHILRPIKTSIVRYLLSRVAVWAKEGKALHPPAAVAKCLVDKTTWDNVRKLRTVATFPPLSASGTINSDRGYHPDTQVYYTGEVGCDVPDKPTLSDAKRAVDTLLDIVGDFPFASEAHRSVWVAGLLTPLARFAHDGNSPIFLVQANSPRVGKTTLVKLISHIISGQDCPVVTHTKNEDEERKRILSYLRSGRSMVLIDNVVGQWGGASINAMTTSRSFEDRVLGQSKVLQVLNDSMWCVTGNNVLLAPDTAERCLHIRLDTKEEKPHLRTGFRYPDLFGTVHARREVLLSAALTILKGYIVAGMPKQEMEVWGSFEPWSRLIRGAMLWAGMIDPAITRAELESEADVGKDNATALILGWAELQRIANAPTGLTAREAHDLLAKGTQVPMLRDALDEIAGGGGRLPNAHTIGRHLREVRDRSFGGKVIRCIPNEKVGHRWFVEGTNQTNSTYHM